eukprot:TRINITY_DN2101_c0_g1_i1.p1 TRINITY_DN2101_c0_g1~~TRINITY_DN2101_c0_g1_i1.p1  ORF type:complete len:389 (+),score=82.54 TRINITY_DN2101_c0_g1_i1:38-1168(+)
MRVSFVALSVLLAVAACAYARPKWHELDGYTFADYERDFGKSYGTPQERTHRASLFSARLQAIRRHNADASKSWKEGVNQLTDRTDEEIAMLRGYRRDIGYASRATDMRRSAHEVHLSPEEKAAMPPHVDWRDKNVVSAVKDQGQCGSCWSFATAETVESHWALATGQLEALSEQFILSCTKNPLHCGGTGGCAGGTAEVGFRTIMEQGGIPSEWTYPYVSYHGKDFECKVDATKTPAAANVTGYTKVPTNQIDPLMQAVAMNGPIAISVDASAWSPYESGVFDGCNQTNPVIDHAVQLVGYGDDHQHGPYWLVRNSWAPTWGENGYIRLKRHTSNAPCGTDTEPQDGTGCDGGPASVTVCGTCGVLFDSSYPKVK